MAAERDTSLLRYLTLLSTALLLIGLSHVPATAQEVTSDVSPVRVMSFNLRYGSANDGDDHWDKRKDYVIQTIGTFTPDLLGTQETLTFQRDYIAEHFPELVPFGVGREDGKEKGELAALFYNKNRFTKTDGGNFWLSPNPEEIGSKSWDAALPRIATWVKLADNLDPDGKPILFLNTHFDHRGKEARLESSKLIRRKLQELGDGHRLVVTGDFNAGAKSDPYRALLKGPENDPDSVRLVDAFLASESPSPDKLEGTFNGFDPSKTSGDRIDWLFVSDDWNVRSSRIDRSTFNGRVPSDHFPVNAVLTHATGKKQVRFLSYNIHIAKGLDDKIDLPRIAKVIRDADPDFVALQEVDKKVTRSNETDQAAELAKLTDMYFYFGKAIDLQGGEYGQAILSRYPLENAQTVLLPNEGNKEQRILLVADSKLGNRSVRIHATHVDHQSDELRTKQAEAIIASTKQDTALSFLAGDLNASLGSQSIGVIQSRWKNPTYDEPVLTFPARSAKRQIDYVFIHSQSEVGPIRVSTIQTEASDHLPILLVAELD